MNFTKFNVGATLFIIGFVIFCLAFFGIIPNITYANLWGVKCNTKDTFYIFSGFLQFAGFTGILTDVVNR